MLKLLAIATIAVLSVQAQDCANSYRLSFRSIADAEIKVSVVIQTDPAMLCGDPGGITITALAGSSVYEDFSATPESILSLAPADTIPGIVNCFYPDGDDQSYYSSLDFNGFLFSLPSGQVNPFFDGSAYDLYYPEDNLVSDTLSLAIEDCCLISCDTSSVGTSSSSTFSSSSLSSKDSSSEQATYTSSASLSDVSQSAPSTSSNTMEKTASTTADSESEIYKTSAFEALSSHHISTSFDANTLLPETRSSNLIPSLSSSMTHASFNGYFNSSSELVVRMSSATASIYTQKTDTPSVAATSSSSDSATENNYFIPTSSSEPPIIPYPSISTSSVNTPSSSLLSAGYASQTQTQDLAASSSTSAFASSSRLTEKYDATPAKTIFTESSSSQPRTLTSESMIISAISSSMPLPSGIRAIVTISTSEGGAFFCGRSITFDANAAPSSGSRFILDEHHTLSCNGAQVYISVSNFAKRDAGSAVYNIEILQIGDSISSNAGLTIPTFDLDGTTLSMFGKDISFGFGLVTGVDGGIRLAAYDLSGSVPLGLQVVVLVVLIAADSTSSSSFSALEMSSTRSVATTQLLVSATSSDTAELSTSTKSSDHVDITPIISPIVPPILIRQTIVVIINEIPYSIAQDVLESYTTKFSSINGIAVPEATAVAVVKVVSIILPIVQTLQDVISHSQLLISGFITTTGVISTVQNAEAASTTTINLDVNSVVTATTTINISAGQQLVVGTTVNSAGVGNEGTSNINMPAGNSYTADPVPASQSGASSGGDLPTITTSGADARNGGVQTARTGASSGGDPSTTTTSGADGRNGGVQTAGTGASSGGDDPPTTTTSGADGRNGGVRPASLPAANSGTALGISVLMAVPFLALLM